MRQVDGTIFFLFAERQLIVDKQFVGGVTKQPPQGSHSQLSEYALLLLPRPDRQPHLVLSPLSHRPWFNLDRRCLLLPWPCFLSPSFQCFVCCGGVFNQSLVTSEHSARALSSRRPTQPVFGYSAATDNRRIVNLRRQSA